MSPLIFNNRTANTFTEKAEVLKEAFFPAPSEADLSNLKGYYYPEAKACSIKITKQEVLAAICCSNPDKAPDPDGIPNKILQACAEKLSDMLTSLFQACAEQRYHPKVFKVANTIVMKKPPGKADYTIPKSYRPIALLNMLSKALESIMAEKITYLAKIFSLLPNTQMGACRGKSTESALELLTEQVHAVWGQGRDKVATLLNINVADAFDSVFHQWLIHNLCKRKIPKWITKWVESFLLNQKTSLTIHRQVMDMFRVCTSIPQGSFISSILYLFYNTDLLDICKRPGTRTSSLRFIDDVNILAYSTSTEENCRTLEKVHKKCEWWAKKHEAIFAP